MRPLVLSRCPRGAPAIVWLSCALSASAAAQTAQVGAREDASSGVVAGRVCVDQDGDASCSATEPGVPRARILLSDGGFAVADSDGRYHLAAVPARRVELRPGEEGLEVREGFGRVQVKLDLGSVGRGAAVRGGRRRVVELGPAALARVDFAVAFEKPPLAEIGPAPVTGPRGRMSEGGYRFRATGKVAPGHAVYVAGREAEVDAAGSFEREVEVRGGDNTLVIADLAPEGDLTFFRQSVAVVRRERGGVLFIPGRPERVASLALPGTREAPAGVTGVGVTAAQGTEVEVGSERVTVGEDGQARLTLRLEPGENLVPVRVKAGDGTVFAQDVPIHGSGPAWASALLGIELGFSPKRREVTLTGSGTAAAQRSFGELDVRAGVSLDTGDVLTVLGREEDPAGDRRPADGLILLRPREPIAAERAIDPELFPPVFGDDGVSGSLNPSGARVWARLRHPRFGEAQLGPFHAGLAGVDVGRYDRTLFGGRVDARAPLGPVTVQALAFGAPPFSADGELQPAAAHDELAGTGGSLYFLRNGLVVPGSEKLRIVLRDGLTGLPLEEKALVRYQDYTIDYVSGRILLAAPLAMTGALGPAAGPLVATPLSGHRPILTADYEHRSAGGARAQVVGGRAGVSVGSGQGGPRGRLDASAVKEHRLDAPAPQARYRLLAAHGEASIGPVSVAGDVAQSDGALFAPAASGGFGFSDTGGLSYLVAPGAAPDAPARAYSVRASVSRQSWGGQLYYRERDPGFSDAASAAQTRARQIGGLARGRAGPVDLMGRFDDRLGADPRDPFGAASAAARDGVVRASLGVTPVTLTAEATFASLELAEPEGGPREQGGRAGLGARADWQVSPELAVNASHHQRLARFGQGPGGLDDTFSALGFAFRPRDDLGLIARGGWGPGVGTQVQVGAERAGEGAVSYGLWTADVDGPNAGRTVVTSGARQRVDERSEAFVEDLFARDVDAARMGRAVGLQVAPLKSLSAAARYERGVRLPFTGEPGLLRDAGSGRLSWLVRQTRLSLLAEVRRERGQAVAESGVDRWQTVGGLMADARPMPWLSLGARLLASKSRNRGLDEATTLEGYAGAALRLDPALVLASYSLIDRTPVASQGGLASRELVHLVSLRPSVLLWDRLRLTGGAVAAFYRAGGATTVLAASLRPAVRVVGGLELAVEAARRSSAPDGEALDALRAEVAYWLEGVVGVALGYNLYGFSGIGVERESGRDDRVYLRLEAAY